MNAFHIMTKQNIWRARKKTVLSIINGGRNKNIKNMNENLNLCEILKDCPKGTKLWSPIWGNVTLIRIDDRNFFPTVFLSAPGFVNISLRSDGKMYDIEEAECLVFPSKDQRDWSKFKAPVERFNP